MKLVDVGPLIEEQLEHWERSHRTQLSAAAIDETSGIVRGCTAAQANVEAAGKFVLLDAAGNITKDPAKASRKLPVWTDDRTLETLMAAVESAGGVLKVRSDHDDTLGARAGFADSFRLVEENGSKRVSTDLHLARSYRDRDIFLETAKTTPKLIGLSIDFFPRYEITADRAMMRVEEVYAVDIVDEGAITREGLFLSRRVDNRAKFQKSQTTKPNSTMADDKKTETKEPTMSEVLSQMTALAAGVKSCMEGLAALQKTMSTAPAADKKVEEVPAEMSAIAKEAKETLAAVKAEREAFAAERANQAKEKAALGLKSGNAISADDAAAEREKLSADRKAESKKEEDKTFLDLVADAKASGKFKKGSEAHEHVMKTSPAKYREHLARRGIYDSAKETAQANRSA